MSRMSRFEHCPPFKGIDIKELINRVMTAMDSGPPRPTARQHGIGAVPGRRPMFGAMTPGIELAERIEQAQILVIVHACDIFANGTAQRHHAEPLCPFGRKRLDRIVDLQRPLTVPDQQSEGCHAIFEQGMKHVR